MDESTPVEPIPVQPTPSRDPPTSADCPTAPQPRQRTGGRRYRTGHPPAERPQSAEDQGWDLNPLPTAGFRARGCLGGLFAICFVSCVLAAWQHLPVIAGLGLCAGSALAVRYCRPDALLRVVVAVPAVFGIAVVLAQLATQPDGGRRSAALPVLQGTLLTLAAVAPWLFAGTTGAVVIALFRGLPQCIRQLRADLNGRRPRAPTARRDSPPPAKGASFRGW
ncbi:MAG: hypothetical protein J2P27_10325 [Actinobacteria bacterium]|nr:hypothetical protein [Actinomycetota bacterium]